MAFIQDELRNATFRGVNFLVKNSRIGFGQKTVVHEYPNSDRVEVEYLGKMPDRFSLDMIIKGSGDQYFTDRNALKTALLNPANGLLLHPYEGEIPCAVVGQPTLDEGDGEQGVARFRVDFIRVTEKVFPTKTADNRGLIEKTRNSVEESVEKFIQDNFGFSYADTYAAAQAELDDISKIYDTAVDTIAIAQEQISTVKNTISSFSNNILGFLSGANPISTGLTGLYNSLTDIGQSPSDQLNLWFDLFDSVPANPVYTTSTAQRIEGLNNTDIINTTAKVQTLANVYNFTPEIAFNSVDEIDEYRENLETRYQEIIQVDTSIPDTSLSITGLRDSDMAYNLGLLRSETQFFLDNLENTVGEVVTIENVQPTTLTQFVFSQYGDLDNYTQIKDLNDIQDPTLISGNIDIII